MNEELSNIYKEAQKALTDDLRQDFYNAVEARTQAYRKINNSANANHALFSGAPAGSQMQYDQTTMLPNTNSMALQALQRQQQNQENWDSYMSYIQDLNDKAAELAAKAAEANKASTEYQNATYAFSKK